jgi:hypothetical protein
MKKFLLIAAALLVLGGPICSQAQCLQTPSSIQLGKACEPLGFIRIEAAPFSCELIVNLIGRMLAAHTTRNPTRIS